MISTLDIPKAVHRVNVATATAPVTQLQPVQPGLSLPPGSAKHPYRLEMRMWALHWRGVRRGVTAEDREYASLCLRRAVTYNRWHYNMVVRRAGA